MVIVAIAIAATILVERLCIQWNRGSAPTKLSLSLTRRVSLVCLPSFNHHQFAVSLWQPLSIFHVLDSIFITYPLHRRCHIRTSVSSFLCFESCSSIMHLSFVRQQAVPYTQKVQPFWQCFFSEIRCVSPNPVVVKICFQSFCPIFNIW